MHFKSEEEKIAISILNFYTGGATIAQIQGKFFFIIISFLIDILKTI